MGILNLNWQAHPSAGITRASYVTAMKWNFCFGELALLESSAAAGVLYISCNAFTPILSVETKITWCDIQNRQSRQLSPDL